MKKLIQRLLDQHAIYQKYVYQVNFVVALSGGGEKNAVVLASPVRLSWMPQ
ncbi:MAG TPA: hypothetical protein VJ044_15145 [Candidatus Hodarchaeales archaeon]|nr:hypothetical protein [Candidatus Hodarchaeales archaeon]